MIIIVEQSSSVEDDQFNSQTHRYTTRTYALARFALAARGWTIMPWEESAQMHEDKAWKLCGQGCDHPAGSTSC